MFKILIDGQSVEANDGETVLDCALRAGIRIPTLCYDQRLKPFGGCRLCLVQIDNWDRPATACTTLVSQGMSVLTHTPDIENVRTTLLRLLAAAFPAGPSQYDSQKEFFHWLQVYGIAPAAGRNTIAADESHPYIHVDFSRCILCYRCVRICEELQGQFVWQVWNRGDATRIRPDSGTTLKESSCVSCGACVDTCPTGALEDKRLFYSGEPTAWTQTTCPYCGVGCQLNAGTRNGNLVLIRPVLDAAVNKGHLCSKGRYASEYVHASERVLQPMIRTSQQWREVSWDEAIAATAEALQNTIQAHGADAVGILGSARATNEEAYLTQKFARVVLGTNNVDCCARVCHAPSAAALKQMLGTGAATNSFDDIESARTILVCGGNPTENHPIVGARIKQAALRGAHLIVIDPRRIELCKFADIHLQLRPGTNIQLLNAMACTIIEENIFDQEFVQERVQNWDEFCQFILRWSPEKAAEACGVPADLIRKAARLYAERGPSVCFHGLGVTEHLQGTEAVMCLANLALITGNLGRAGAGINPLRGQNNVQGAAHMGCDPDILTGSIPIALGFPQFEREWQAALPKNKGKNLLEMIDAASKGKVKLLWVIGYDVLLTNPNLSATRLGFQNMETIIVQDMFMNETAREFGTIFLPACSSFEKNGTFMNAERRIQRVRQALPPLGDSKSDWEIICDVARGMGRGSAFSFSSPREIWDEIRRVWPGGAGISYARLEQEGLQWPCPEEAHDGTTILHAGSFTAGKRASLHCAEFEPSPEEMTKDYPLTLVTGRVLHQFNAGTMTGRGAHLLLRSTDHLDISPADAERVGASEEDQVHIVSRYGDATLPAHITTSVPEGLLFATFHDAGSLLNRVTSRVRERRTAAPEFKITAVRIQKSSQSANTQIDSPLRS